jgi:hypothetical protein
LISELLSMSSRSSVFVCALAALVAAAGCGREEESAPCVATPSVALARDRAAIGSPFKVSYTFDVAQNAAITQDYLVFVHVLDDQGERLWGDDHPPAEPTYGVLHWRIVLTAPYSSRDAFPAHPPQRIRDVQRFARRRCLPV